MKKILFFLILIIAIFAAYYYLNKPQTPDVEINHNMVVQQIEELGKLEVIKYTIQDMVEYKKVREWLPNSKTAVIVVGEVIACVDLTKLQPEDVTIIGDSLSLLLPNPEICHFKVDHSKSRVYDVEYGLWETSEIVDEAYQHAEKQLYREAQRMGIETDARANAVKILIPLLRALGHSKVGIEFKGGATANNKNKKIQQSEVPLGNPLFK